MCRPATCPSCSKVTWAGCGQHVDQVMAGVPRQQQCTCNEQQQPAGASFWQGLTSR